MLDNVIFFLKELIAQYGIFIPILFVAFLLIFRFVAKIFLRIALIAIGSIMFPFFSRAFFGIPVEINFHVIFSFLFFGFSVFFIYYFLKILWKISEVIAEGFERFIGEEECKKKK